jgi:hypothetical protein
MGNRENDLKSENFEGYGEEMIDLVKVANRQSNEIRELKGKVESVDKQIWESKEEEFFAELDDLVPGWESINKNPGFLNWLQGIDPLNNRSRQQLLEEAQDRLDAKRVAVFLKTWQREGDGGTHHATESRYTLDDLKKATQDRVHGRITEEAYKKICDDFQNALSRVDEG